jgi:hypothetical protein
MLILFLCPIYDINSLRRILTNFTKYLTHQSFLSLFIKFINRIVLIKCTELEIAINGSLEDKLSILLDRIYIIFFCLL